MKYDPLPQVCTQNFVPPRINWVLAERDGSIRKYHDVRQCLTFLPDNSYRHVDDINTEICHVSKQLLDAAMRTLPTVYTSKAQRFRDRILSALCAQSRAARMRWKKSGSPLQGPLYEEKCHLYMASS